MQSIRNLSHGMVKMKFFKSLASGAADLGGVLGGGS